MFDPAIMKRAVGRLVPQARPAPDGPQPGDVRRRGRQRAHDVAVLPEAAVGEVVRQRVRRARRRRGCGSRCCSPTSPRRSPRAGARRRPTRCARPARRRSPTSASPTARSPRSRRASCTVGDECVVAAGELIPGDGDIVEGIASVDESAITGESAPVIRESGGDRCVGHRRHARAVRPDRRADHARSRARPSSTG